MRCPDCPVPEGLACRGEALAHKCADARYRAYFLARAARGESSGAVAAMVPMRCPAGSPVAPELGRACRDLWCRALDRIVCRTSECSDCNIPTSLLPLPPHESHP